MKALCWHGVNDLRVESVPEPRILDRKDAIVKVSLTSVCGSDLHLLNGYVPTMRAGDIIGHEFIGEVVDVGPKVEKIRKGDRVVVVSVVGCGGCWFCQHDLWSLCDNSNPQPQMQETINGQATAGVFGYSHAFGGYAGSHAEYVRVPFADHGCFVVPESLSDEQALFVSDAFATGSMAADLCGITPGDVVAVWGCGGVGLLAIQTAFLLGAERVIAIDRVPERLAMARSHGKAEVVNYETTKVVEHLIEITGGRGPDSCIDAVGMEAEGVGAMDWYDRTKQALRLETDRPFVLREMIRACRKGGTLAIVGAYAGFVDKFPIGALMTKGLTVRAGQQHGQRYARRLFDHIVNGDIDPSYLITHTMSLDDAPRGYRMFKEKSEGCVRVVFRP